MSFNILFLPISISTQVYGLQNLKIQLYKYQQKSHFYFFSIISVLLWIYIPFFGKFWKENWQHPMFIPKKSTVHTLLDTTQHCIWIYIYFLQWASPLLSNEFINSSITTVYSKFLFLHLFFPRHPVCIVYWSGILGCCWLIKGGEEGGRGRFTYQWVRKPS